jgi:hypothetical protein
MRSRWNVLLVGVVLGLVACSGPRPGEVVLETEHVSYAPGAELSLRLENESSQTLNYNLCMAVLQRHEGESWTVVPPPTGEVCPAVLYPLSPRESASIQRALAETLPEGEYRYRLEVEWDDGERQELVSPTFLVVKPSTP